VTPTTYTQVQEFPKPLTVGARSHNSVSWSSADTSIATVTPNVGSEVAIKVNRPGQTTVTAGGVQLKLSAEMAGTGVLVVQIQQ
jgi:Big-like domain-containing protein